MIVTSPFRIVAICVILLPILLLGKLAAQSKQIRFEHLSVDQGLSQSSGRAMMQDSHGFIWIGTEDGLNKYDGIDFQIYRHDPDDSSSIAGSFILGLYEDSFGFIWIRTVAGLDRLDPKVGIFQHYQRRLARPTDDVTHFYEDKGGTIWVGTNNGLQRFDREEDKFTKIVVDSTYDDLDDIRLVHEDQEGMFWLVAGSASVYLMNRDNETFTRLPLEISNGGEEVEVISALHEDRQGTLWFAGYPVGLLGYDRQSGKFSRLKGTGVNGESLAGAFITSLNEDQSGNIWLAVERAGVYLFRRDTQTFTRLGNDPHDPQSLSSNEVVSLMVDRANTVWVGTAGGGINKYDPEKQKFYQLKNSLPPGALGSPLVWALLEDSDGHVWIGSQSGGLLRVNRETGDVLRLQHDPGDPYSLSSNVVYAIQEDEFGTIWVGTANAGLNTCDRKTLTCKPYLSDSADLNRLLPSRVRRLYADQKGSLWIGTMGRGLGRLQIAEKRLTYFSEERESPKSLSSRFVSHIFEDSRGNFWVGTEGQGLNRLIWDGDDTSVASFRRYQHNSDDSNSLSHNRVMSICEESEGVLWIGTFYGLTRFNPATGEFKRYTSKQGLPNDVVYGVLADEQGHIWFSTNKGLSKLDPRTEQFTNYDLADGLQSLEFNTGAFFKSNGGEMFFGGVKGVNFFHPVEVKQNPNVPPIVITGLKKFDSPVDLASGPVELSYKDNFLAFEFTALSYTNPQKNQYAYKLDGFNQDWIRGGNQRYATFTNLDPGQYTFRVQGSNNDGIWNHEGASLQIVITPPFWHTWWFRLLAAVAGLVLIGLTILGQRNRIKRKAELDQRISELKLQALRAQMNPHFVFNTINSIQYFISSNEKKAAFQYLSKFSKLMRKMLENAEKSSLPISEELDSLKLYLDLELLRFEGKFHYDLQVDSNIDLENQLIPTMLIQPFVENAIHHGLKFKRSRGALKINLEKENGSLVCTIEDNGIGIDKARALMTKLADHHKPTGIKVTRERLVTLNSLKKRGQGVEIIDMGTTNGGANGTKVKIVIPTSE